MKIDIFQILLLSIVLFIALSWEVCKISTRVFHKMLSATEALDVAIESTHTYMFCIFNPQLEISQSSYWAILKLHYAIETASADFVWKHSSI